jgi:hypothetical protein
LVRAALTALHQHATHWTYVPSGNVYASDTTPGADETAQALLATDRDEVDCQEHGEVKVASQQESRDTVGTGCWWPDPASSAGQGIAPDDPATGSPAPRVTAADRYSFPDTPDALPQVVDVRDLSWWLLDAAQVGTTGTFNAVGPSLPFDQRIELSRAVGGHEGPVVMAPRTHRMSSITSCQKVGRHRTPRRRPASF